MAQKCCGHYPKESPSMNSLTPPHCAACPFRREERLCMTPDGKHPPDCPTALCAAQAEACLADYEQPEVRRMAREAAIVERESYALRPDGMRLPCRPRILEIVAFAKAMDYRRLGLVFCIGLRAEAKETALIFEAHGLEVVSAVCKVGRIPKTRLGLAEGQLLCPRNPESMCNPLLQARLMNEAQVELNVLLGLCVGHDTLALRQLKAPTTVLAVKDRMLGHNPLAALYSGYFAYLKKPV